MVEAPSTSAVPAGCSTSISGAFPVPVRTMLKGFSSKSLLAMSSSAVRVPPAVGLKLTVKVVLAPTARLELKEPTMNSDGFAPALVIFSPFSVAAPVLRTVTVVAALRALTLVVGKVSVAAPSTKSVPTGCSTTISGAFAVPVSVMSKGFSSKSLLVIARDALRTP